MSQLLEIDFQDRRLKPLGHPSGTSCRSRYYLWDKELSRCHPDGPGQWRYEPPLGELLWLALRFQLDIIRDLISTHECCLLCYQADPNMCHRSIVSKELGSRFSVAIGHL
jgi:hypothetical protein